MNTSISSDEVSLPAEAEVLVSDQPTIILHLNASENLQPEKNECLNCHADKDRLIETADPVVEEAEGESKGVG